MNYKRLLFLWLVIVSFSGGVSAQVYSDRQIRSYKLNDNATVDVQNKYGKVHIITWDKDSVRFEVDLRIQTSDRQKLYKLKNNISFDFTSTNYYIVAKTHFTKTGGIFSDVIQTIVPSNDVSINYTVYLPKSVTLKIENKFGDLYIDDFAGNLDVALSNGNLKVNHLQGNTNIKIVSGDAVINNLDNSTLTLSSSEIRIREAGQLSISSKNSEVEIDEAESIKISSRYDKYKLGEVSKISGSGYFTTINVEELQDEFNLQNKYHGISVESIAPNFNLVNVVSEYTDIDLRFEPIAAYTVDITHNKDAVVKLPYDVNSLETKQLDDEGNLLLTYGTVGNTEKAKHRKVKIVAEKKCYINIIHR